MKTLSIEDLESIPAGEIIARGKSNKINPLNLHEYVTWIAFKTYEGRWVIKYGKHHTPDAVIMTIGLPVVCVNRVQQLMPCDADTLWRYGENPYHTEDKQGQSKEVYDALVSVVGRERADDIYKSCQRDSLYQGHPIEKILKGEYNHIMSMQHA